MKENKDYIMFARYRALFDDVGNVTDLEFVYANKKMRNVLGADPKGSLRSSIMPMNDEMCDNVYNVIKLNIAKCFSYQGDERFGFIKCVIEPDANEYGIVNVYSVDVEMLMKADNILDMKNNMSTIISMFGITIMHANLKEHYVYSDSILSLGYGDDVPEIYITPNIRDTREIYNWFNSEQRVDFEEKINMLKSGRLKFVNFEYVLDNGNGKTLNVKGYMIPERMDGMYTFAVQY